MVPPDLCQDPTMNQEEEWSCRSCADSGNHILTFCVILTLQLFAVVAAVLLNNYQCVIGILAAYSQLCPGYDDMLTGKSVA